MSNPGVSNNILLDAIQNIIVFICEIKNRVLLSDKEIIRNNLVSDLFTFKKNAHAQGVSEKNILATHYCLCTALDEFISLSEWGRNSDWSENPLLNYIYHESWGGERFYIILNEMLRDIENCWPTLEILYVLLSLGYEGKYYNHSKEKLTSLTSSIKKSLDTLLINNNIHDADSQTIYSKTTLAYLSDKWLFYSVAGGTAIFNGISFCLAQPILHKFTLTY